MANWIISSSSSKLEVQFSKHTPRGAALQLHSVQILALDGGKTPASLPGLFTTVQNTDTVIIFNVQWDETSLKMRTNWWFWTHRSSIFWRLTNTFWNPAPATPTTILQTGLHCELWRFWDGKNLFSIFFLHHPHHNYAKNTTTAH